MRGVWINSMQQKRKFDRVCLTFFELAPSESDVARASVAPKLNLFNYDRHMKSTASEPGHTFWRKKYNTAKKFSGSVYSSYKICIPIFFYNICKNDHKKKNYSIDLKNFEVSYLPKCEIVHSPSIFLASSQTAPSP